MLLLKLKGSYEHRVDDIDIGYYNEVTQNFSGELMCLNNKLLIGTIKQNGNNDNEMLVLGTILNKTNLQLYYLSKSNIVFNDLKYDHETKKFIGLWKNAKKKNSPSHFIELSINGIYNKKQETLLQDKVKKVYAKIKNK